MLPSKTPDPRSSTWTLDPTPPGMPYRKLIPDVPHAAQRGVAAEPARSCVVGGDVGRLLPERGEGWVGWVERGVGALVRWSISPWQLVGPLVPGS